MDSVLRPRDIQTRIRAGESPEAVAAAAQTTVEKIMGFAGPVMAERAHIADQAQKASVRRRVGSSPIGHLGAAVGDHLRTRDVDPETVEWDAWRREDGRWTLVADFRLGGAAHRATFVYDVQGRYVVAEDDESRALVGERHPGTSAAVAAPSGPPAPTPAVDLVDLVADASDSDALGDDAIALVSEPPVSPASVAPEPASEPAPEPTPAAAAAPARPSRPLSRVPDEEPELALDFDLPAPVSPSSPTSGATPSRPVERPGTRPAARHEVPAHEPTGDDSLTEDLTEAAAAFRAVPPVPGMVESGDADWMVTQATERLQPRPAPAEPTPSPAAQVPAARVEPPVAPTPAEPVSRVDEPTDHPDDEPAARQAEDEQTPEPTPAKPARKPTKSRGRASVPSWDEIMFGSSKND